MPCLKAPFTNNWSIVGTTYLNTLDAFRLLDDRKNSHLRVQAQLGAS